MIEITAVVKSANEIIEPKGDIQIESFVQKYKKKKAVYTAQMDRLSGKRIVIHIYNDPVYDYRDKDYAWVKSWLKDFKGGGKIDG